MPTAASRCPSAGAGSAFPEALHYPVSELAARHGASVVEATADPVEAHAKAGRGDDAPARLPWPPA